MKAYLGERIFDVHQEETAEVFVQMNGRIKISFVNNEDDGWDFFAAPEEAEKFAHRILHAVEISRNEFGS